ncbi:MAG: CHASE domain-containing protein [Chloroflexi bacterium]|nr:CHASE domain-containing protein [Chloroflexota bacterium]
MPLRLPHLSVRLKLGLVLALLVLLLFGVLGILVSTSQQFTDDMRAVQAVGDMRTMTTTMELLARQITTTELDKRAIVHTIQSEMAAVEAYAQTLVSLWYTTPNLSRAQFTRFLTNAQAPTHTVQDAVAYVAFVRRVASDQRVAFEQAVVREGFSEFAIHEHDASQQPIPAQPRDVYFPITYIVPLDANRAALGLDQASNSSQLAALEQAARTGKAVLTTTLTDPSDDLITYLLYAPVYATTATPESDEARQAALDGFILLALDLAPVMQEAMEQISEGSSVIRVDDVTQPDTPLLAYYNTRIPSSGLRGTLPLDLMGRRWQVTIALPIDTRSARQELNAAMQSLDRSIDELQPAINHSQAVLPDLPAHDLRYAYNDLRMARLALKWDVRSFVEASDVDAGRLPSLEKESKDVYEGLGLILTILQEKGRIQAERNVQSSLIAGIGGVVAVLAGAYVVYNIIRDLRRVKQTALRLAEGELEARSPVRSRDELGQIGSTLNTMADRIQALFQTVRDNEARYRILAENVADVIAQTDPQGNFLYVSPACRPMLGYEPEEMVGTNRRDYVCPEDYEVMAANIAAGNDTHEYRLRRKDGSYVWVEATFRPLDNGEIISVARDVTERKAAVLEREAARLERERLQEQVIAAQQQAIRELSSPVIPLTDHIIIMPLVGSIDTTRARDITRGLLAGISQHRAHIAIIDVTGVPIVDSGVADHLNRTIQAAQLKGTRTIISGISPAVAETIVDLGIDWGGIETVRDLQTGLQLALHDRDSLPLNGNANGYH